MKGWELYSWFDDSWRFALLEGTNRVKADDEIVKQRLPLRDLLTKLAGLKKGESVFWLTDETFTLPPAALEKEVRRANG
jgi:hypothetical protein